MFQIRFLGGKLGEAIANEYDVSTVGDLLCVMYVIPCSFAAENLTTQDYYAR
jgi:hypothetical protein